MPRILLVDDDQAFRKSVARILKHEGYEVLEAATGKSGVERVAAAPPDLILLDLVMPGINGLEVCQALKQEVRTAALPILILTGNDQEGQEISCLDLGADDYLVKPVKRERLLAHCRALLRRAQQETGVPTSSPLRVGALQLDYDRKRVVLGTKEYLHLTPKEFGLLHYLACISPTPQEREVLYKKVWGIDAPSEGSLKTVDVHVRRIRLKLGWRRDEWLVNVSGRGYCLKAPA